MGKYLDLDKIAVIAIIILAFALRIYRLDHQSIWYDEGLSVYFAEQRMGDMLAEISTADHPPLYFVALHLWIRIAGRSEFPVRYLSLAWGVMAVPLVFKLSERLASRGVGFWAAFLLSISPYHIWFSQETRMYTMVVALSLASVYVFLKLLSTWRTKHLWLCAALNLLGLYTHFYFVFIILFENVVFLIWWLQGKAKQPFLHWIAAQLSIAIGFLPWAGFAVEEFMTGATYWEGALGLLTAAKDTFTAFSVGHTMQGKTADLATWGFVVLAAVGVLVSLWKRKSEPNTQYPISSIQYPTGLVLLYLLVPMAALFAISYHRPKFAPRYLLTAMPAFYLLMAIGLAKLASNCSSWVRGSRLLGTVALVGLLCSLGFVSVASAGSLTNYYFEDKYTRSDFRSVAEYIGSHAEDKDAIILVGGHMLPAFAYYYQGSLPVYPLPDRLVVSTKDPLDYRAAEQLNSIGQGRERLWLVLWQNRIVDPTDVILDQLMMNCLRLEVGRNFHHEFALLLFSLENRPRFGTGPKYHYQANFADQIQLLGYDLDSFQAKPGQTLHLALYWEALREMDRDYLVFTHLISQEERIYGQHDKIAGDDAYPTSHWKERTIIRDKFQILVFPDTPPGDYTLEVGLYWTEPGIQRLPLKSGGDRALLTNIAVVP
ncbi:MAG TPA: hypothetical protein EYP49_12735 [Anaerolineae bacterium]|nr:hypothetical protein [Anaerolineae bacterium]